MKRIAAALAAALMAGSCGSGGTGAVVPTPDHGAPMLHVRLRTDEPEAVLAILALRSAGETPPEAAWDRLFGSEGYRRLKAREASLGRPFTDEEFRAFVLSPGLAERREALARTLEAWRTVDMEGPARLAFAYLPEGAAIRASVYPSIKPKTNSFVFEVRTDPAIFLYLDPTVSAPDLANTIAHELHHIGLAGACEERAVAGPKGVQDAIDGMGGFGEGLAMLAAAGGAGVHPHLTSDAEERAVWDAAVARVPEDMVRLEAFFLDLAAGRMTEEEATTRGFRFISDEGVPQGPFYTVGWHMAALVERELGRERVVTTVCDPAALLVEYERAAVAAEARTGRPVPRWSPALLEAVSGG